MGGRGGNVLPHFHMKSAIKEQKGFQTILLLSKKKKKILKYWC